MALGGCGLLEASYRFRMIVEVDTPEGPVSGSSVYEVTAHKTLRLTSEETAGGGGLRGEAVVVDLPNGPLFVLLKIPDARGRLASEATQALSGGKQLADIDEYVAAVRSLGSWFGGAEAELPRKYWPLMVRFRVIGDPKSVERVDPEAIGVRRIRLETTSDKVTDGIVERLGWLRHEGRTLDPEGGPTINPTFAQTIRQRDFRTDWHR
jgi:hypothetical protein